MVHAAGQRVAILGLDEAAAVVVGEQDVVVLRQEAHGRRRVRGRARRVREVEELATALVAERDELRPQPLDDCAQPGQAAPRRHVGDRGRAERGEVAQHDRVDRGIGDERPAEPRLRRRRAHLRAPAPEPARRHLHEREPDLAGVREGGRVEVREPLREDRAQLGPAPRLLLQERSARARRPAPGRRPRSAGACSRVSSQLRLEDRLHRAGAATGSRRR